MARNPLLFSVLLTVFAFSQSGCQSKSAGFNRGELASQIGVKNPQYDDKEIKDAFKKKANLPKPFKLAVYFATPKPGKNVVVDWRWTEQDKALLFEVAKDLKSSGLVSDIFPILNSLVEKEDLRSIRLAAAKHQADAVLIISGVGDIDRYLNKNGWSYALILPTLFVSGTQSDTLFIAQATMWDVKNELLYLTAEAETTTQDTHSAAFGKSDRQLIEEAKVIALKGLRKELKEQIEGRKF